MRLRFNTKNANCWNEKKENEQNSECDVSQNPFPLKKDEMTTELTTMPQFARMRLADSQAICQIPSSISAKSRKVLIDRLFDTNADETRTESTGIVIEAPL
ncbi:hypothetical protein DAPPUDRAFT_112622 [Daphnia pulex]|uniref:Uncharacterized protein n=1 Tax=Daphnia pulex TaxID=6669 RepID=E9HCP2_DAPPU|nr:hypothetical protein DAPPUDRAFT_112622 [Daphnia pulex]|eukprot:EFX70547.1 hypothetical protein DAPPUDRAFT_112622 [Daphnia pulex]